MPGISEEIFEAAHAYTETPGANIRFPFRNKHTDNKTFPAQKQERAPNGARSFCNSRNGIVLKLIRQTDLCGVDDVLFHRIAKRQRTEFSLGMKFPVNIPQAVTDAQ